MYFNFLCMRCLSLSLKFLAPSRTPSLDFSLSLGFSFSSFFTLSLFLSVTLPISLFGAWQRRGDFVGGGKGLRIPILQS